MLAEQIHSTSYKIVKHLKACKQEEPTFEANSPIINAKVETPEFEQLRNSLNEAANDLLLLVNGPKTFFRTFLTTHYELAAYQTAVEHNFFEHVPIKGKIHLTNLASLVGMDADRTGRFLRLLATQRVFKELEDDFFAHTASSIALATDSEVNSAVGMQYVIFAPLSSPNGANRR